MFMHRESKAACHYLRPPCCKFNIVKCVVQRDMYISTNRYTPCFLGTPGLPHSFTFPAFSISQSPPVKGT